MPRLKKIMWLYFQGLYMYILSLFFSSNFVNFSRLVVLVKEFHILRMGPVPAKFLPGMYMMLNSAHQKTI